MLFKSATILAVLLFAWSVLALGLLSTASHDTAVSLVRAKLRQPSLAPQRPDAQERKATIRHAILRDGDLRNEQDDMAGKLREAMKRRLQAQSMT